MPRKDSSLKKPSTKKASSKGKAQILVVSNRFRIQLPRHLYEGKQKYLCLGLSNTPANRLKADKVLLAIQRDIDYEEFDITLEKYVKLEEINITPRKPVNETVVVKQLLIKDLVADFNEKYFFTHKRTRQSEKTFKTYMYFINRFLVDCYDQPLSKEVITKTIAKTHAGSKTREEIIKVLGVFCKAFQFEYNFVGLSKYKPKYRNLPTDIEIIEAWNKIQVEKISGGIYAGSGVSWGWVYGVIATYGIRTHEILAIDYEKSFKPPHYKLYIDEKITEGTKTGSRVVFPIPIDWVELFDLANPKTKVLKNGTIINLSILLGVRTRQRGVYFPAYHLRHRYAVRGHELGFPIDDMSRWMGHSIKKHTDVYQKYMKEDTQDKVYEAGLQRAEEMKNVKIGRPSYDELERNLKDARTLIAQLEAELKLTKAKKTLPSLVDEPSNLNKSTIKQGTRGQAEVVVKQYSKRTAKSGTHVQLDLLNNEELEHFGVS